MKAHSTKASTPADSNTQIIEEADASVLQHQEQGEESSRGKRKDNGGGGINV